MKSTKARASSGCAVPASTPGELDLPEAAVEDGRGRRIGGGESAK